MIYRVEGASKILLYFLNDRVINLVSDKMIVCSNNRLCYNQVGSNPTSVSLGSMVELVDKMDLKSIDHYDRPSSTLGGATIK